MNSRELDSKFTVHDNLAITNSYTGEPIPRNEPLFVFRAQDALAIHALLAYRELCIDNGCSQLHLESIVDACQKFKAWQIAHPDKVKTPTT